MSNPPEDRMNELRELFFETAEELVQRMNDEALRLEKAPGDTEASRGLRRTVHTLKGDAAACGFRELSELAHEFEDVLSLENPALAARVPEIALRAADTFAALLDAYRGKTKLPSIDSIRAEIAGLAHGHESAAPANTKAKTKRQNTKHAIHWSEYEHLAIARAVEEGKRVLQVVVELDPQCGMPIAARQMLRAAIAGLGEILALYPPEGSTEKLSKFEAALVTNKSADQIKAQCKIPTISLDVKIKSLGAKAQGPALAAPGMVPQPSVPVLETASEAPSSAPAIAGTAEPASNLEPTPSAVPSSAENILRVDAERIDGVLNLVGELILAKSMLQTALLEFGQRFPKDGLRGKFNDAMAFQARILTDLQRSVMKIRMVPVDQLFRRFPRMVRDVAKQCGKEVELVVRGGDTDLDKGILDAIAEPLTHLLRNAIGHGIELPAERAGAGKNPQGTLRLAAYHQGNQVVIDISDDGAGINVEALRRKAVEQKVLRADEAAHMNEAEALDLIFRPGFSTAKEITELSGRGIGLDVVQSVITHLKGSVKVETVVGRGTTFRLRLPLTLAIIRALLFQVDQRLYAMPLNAVSEITRTTEEEIHEVENYEVLQLRNDVLPLLRLGSAINRTPESGKRKSFVLVINNGDRKFGLIVDELAGEEELVIKALDDQSITTELVSGASILGDGRVVLILNLAALVNRFTEGQRRGNLRMAGLLSNLAGVRAQGAAAGLAGTEL